MLRCVSRRLSLGVAAAVLGLVGLPAAAQAPRNFPATALRGEVVVVQPPDLLLNGKPARLAPGARIRAQNNLMIVSGALATNQRLVVHYTTDLSGLLSEVWILTAAERARMPWPTTREQAAAWTFDPVGQTWTRP
ncbi:MAG: hypothetical protein KIT17_02475 [Rubrivivax sp.]|nr:hypothetical protein [Rubrivivax sp.]